MSEADKSYNKIRQTIGGLGVALPLLIYLHAGLVGRCWSLQDSISHYFFTTGIVFFEGVLWILGLVLIYYPAYRDEKKGDVLLTSFSGFFAWGVALIPTNSNSANSCAIFQIEDSATRNAIHLTCAGLMLAIFSYMSIKLFTRSNPAHYGEHNPRFWKSIRNGIYVMCGVVTLLSIVMIGVLTMLEKSGATIGFKYTFWFEVSSIVPFGVSWLVKGGFLFTDRDEVSTLGRVKNLIFKQKKSNPDFE